MNHRWLSAGDGRNQNSHKKHEKHKKAVVQRIVFGIFVFFVALFFSSFFSSFSFPIRFHPCHQWLFLFRPLRYDLPRFSRRTDDFCAKQLAGSLDHRVLFDGFELFAGRRFWSLFDNRRGDAFGRIETQSHR
jgi:hypothetical protein